jgi:hypothetical protein
MVRYSVKVDENYTLELAFRARVEDKLPFRWERIVFAMSAFLALSVIVGDALSIFSGWELAFGTVFAIGCAVGPSMERRKLKKLLQAHPLYNAPISIQLDWDAYRESVGQETAKIEWPSFIRAVRVVDGFLLFMGTGLKMTRWLPDSAVVEGTVAEANLLLKNHVQGYVG